MRNSLKILLYFILFSLATSCGKGFFKKVDTREVPISGPERAKKNVKEGRGVGLGEMIGVTKRGTTYEFSSSNPMWRATLEILDFLPLSNVDYSGGIITTDWYNEGTASDESIKITVRFLTNEIRADGVKIIVHKKKCSVQQKCTVKKVSSALESELQLAILKKATIYEKDTTKNNKKKFKRKDVN